MAEFQKKKLGAHYALQRVNYGSKHMLHTIIHFKMLGVAKLTKLFISDNSGARFAKCIHVYFSPKRKVASAGVLVLVSLKTVLPNKKIKQGDLLKAVVVCSNDRFIRFSGYILRSFKTAIVLLNSTSLLPRAKRAKGIMLEEVRGIFKQGLKVLALASLVL